MDRIIEWIYKKVKQVCVFIGWLYSVALYYYGPWIVNSILLLLFVSVVYLVYKYKKSNKWKKLAVHPKWVRNLSNDLQEFGGSLITYGEGWTEIVVNKADKAIAAQVITLAIGNRPEDYKVVTGTFTKFSHNIRKA